jgi:MSHA biogenesis protein MshN
MSVVNKMLRDLDNREYAKPVQVKSANYIEPSSSKALWAIIICLSFFCVAAASYSVYLVRQEATDEPSKNPESAALEKGDRYAALDIKPEPKARLATNNIQAPQQSISTAQAFLPTPGKEIVLGYASAGPDLSNNVEVATSPTQFSVSPSDGSKGQLSTLRARAHMASQKKNDAEVVRLLQQILVIAPDETKTRKQLAALMFSNNQLSEAQQVLTMGIKQAPADSSMRLMQSRILFKQGNNQSAFTVLAQHPYSALANDELISFRAALAEKIGEYELAQQDYQVLVQRNPSEAKWWLGLGVSQDKQKLNQQAIVSYKQAQALNQLPQQVDSFVAERLLLLAGRL